jgi:hypothetical protein
MQRNGTASGWLAWGIGTSPTIASRRRMEPLPDRRPGPRIRTWINGQPIEDLTDEAIYRTHPSGFIGLQVHAIARHGPYEVAWRDLRLREPPPAD